LAAAPSSVAPSVTATASPTVPAASTAASPMDPAAPGAAGGPDRPRPRPRPPRRRRRGLATEAEPSGPPASAALGRRSTSPGCASRSTSGSPPASLPSATVAAPASRGALEDPPRPRPPRRRRRVPVPVAVTGPDPSGFVPEASGGPVEPPAVASVASRTPSALVGSVIVAPFVRVRGAAASSEAGVRVVRAREVRAGAFGVALGSVSSCVRTGSGSCSSGPCGASSRTRTSLSSAGAPAAASPDHPGAGLAGASPSFLAGVPAATMAARQRASSEPG
jgi:hypothetical protein